MNKQKKLSSARRECHAAVVRINTTKTPRSSGIYGLFNIDGAPINTRDAQYLGLPAATEVRSWQAIGHDAYLPNAISHHQSASGFTILVGEVDEAETLAATLGLQRTTPNAALAEAALGHYGTELPAILIGEWSLLHRAPNGRLTLMLSAGKRDRLHYAVRDGRVAVAPNVFALAKIAWVDNAVDAAGLLFPMGRADVRAGRGDSTMLKGTYQLAAGASVVINPDGSIHKYLAQVLVEQPRWQGSYADAVFESEALMRHIISTKLARNAKVAPMLSGGLDSSLLTWLCAGECGPDTDLTALTSVAPTHSGIDDESAFADLVARTIGMQNRHVFPAHDVNIYRPPDYILAGGSGPILPNRHCLTDAFQIAARDMGATLIIDGTFGEMSVTARLPSPNPLQKLRSTIGPVLRSTPFFQLPSVEATPFHVRLAPHLLANLPEPIRAAACAPPVDYDRLNPDGLLGYMPGIEKALAQTNEFYPGAVRMTHPYRDIRLLRLFAPFPIKMLTKSGADRGIGRSMMKGHLPDAIRLRRVGMPASPDHLPRLKRQADAARLRIPRFRKAEIDDWLDLDWLDVTLQSVATRGPVNVDQANEVQLTAIVAEFLFWWRMQI